MADHGGRGDLLPAAFFGRFRAEAAAVPVAAARGGIGQDGSGGEVVGERQARVVRGEIRGRGAGAEQVEQRALARSGDAVVDQAGKGVLPARPAHPRGDEAAAEHERESRPAGAEKAEQGEGGQGLAEETERDAHPGGAGLLEQPGQPGGVPGEEEALLILRRGPQQVVAGERAAGLVRVIAQADPHSGVARGGQFQQPVGVGHGPPVAVRVGVQCGRAQGGQVFVATAQGPGGPGVGRGVGPAEEEHLGLEVCVEQGAGDVAGAEGRGQQGNARGRLAGLGHRRVDEEDRVHGLDRLRVRTAAVGRGTGRAAQFGHTDSRVLWNTTSGNSSWVCASRQLPSAR